jgi:hypothetical protein
MNVQSQADIERSVLGRDLATAYIAPKADLGRDLTLLPDGTDVATVTGMDTLTQGLTLALTTRLGDNLFDVGYGFDGINSLADETDPILQRERVRIAIINTIKRDPRIRQINDVQLEGDVLRTGSAQSTSQQRALRALDVTVSFVTLATTQGALSLTEVIPNA